MAVRQGNKGNKPLIKSSSYHKCINKSKSNLIREQKILSVLILLRNNTSLSKRHLALKSEVCEQLIGNIWNSQREDRYYSFLEPPEWRYSIVIVITTE